MTGFQEIFWLGVGLAVLGNVIIYIINYTTMAKKNEPKKPSLYTLLRDPQCKTILDANGIQLGIAESRINEHKSNFERLKKGQPDAVWDFDKITEPEKLAKKIVAYCKERNVASDKKALRDKINKLSVKKQEILVKQLNILVGLYLEDEHFFDEFNLEQVRAEHMVTLYERKLQEAKNRLEKFN